MLADITENYDNGDAKELCGRILAKLGGEKDYQSIIEVIADIAEDVVQRIISENFVIPNTSMKESIRKQVINELCQIYSGGKNENGYYEKFRELFPLNEDEKIKYRWIAKQGACEICQLLKGEYSEKDLPRGRPHPNCKCDIVAVDGAADNAKPYLKSRPSYGKNQIEDVWNNHVNPITGASLDPSGNTIKWDKTKPRGGQWDMGHIPGQKYSDMHKKYIDGEISLEDFLNWYRDPQNYRPELPSTNRSGLFE
jgi:hypothetical protein